MKDNRNRLYSDVFYLESRKCTSAKRFCSKIYFSWSQKNKDNRIIYSITHHRKTVVLIFNFHLQKTMKMNGKKSATMMKE